jgi:hypothetical protein
MNLEKIVMKVFPAARLSAGLAAAVLVTMTTGAEAQERFPVGYRSSAAETQYLQQHAVEVGDIPGHKVRIYEISRTFQNSAPKFRGVVANTEYNRGFSDYTDVNGRNWGYGRFQLESGDKVFTRWEGTSSSALKPDGTRQNTSHSVMIITGGTGAFIGIRGMLKNTSAFDPATGMNASNVNGEYWFEQ